MRSPPQAASPASSVQRRRPPSEAAACQLPPCHLQSQWPWSSHWAATGAHPWLASEEQLPASAASNAANSQHADAAGQLTSGPARLQHSSDLATQATTPVLSEPAPTPAKLLAPMAMATDYPRPSEQIKRH